MNILEIKNVTYNYSNSNEKVLSSVNQKFEIGKFYAIIGKSGAGKSTLLSLLAGLDKPKKGQILFKGNDIEKDGYSNHRKNNISLVFQNYNLMKLSGGQQQRVAIARALVSEAPIILADEPTGNLDVDTAGEIIEILKKLAKERNKCVIVVTHSKEVANSADIILELRDRKLKKINN